MGYQTGVQTITITQDGKPAAFVPSFVLKTVAVYIAGEYAGTWPNRAAAKQALNLRDMPAKGR